MSEETRIDQAIRPEQAADEPDIRRVPGAAFAGPAETGLVTQYLMPKRLRTPPQDRHPSPSAGFLLC
jgi:hypothetical protein